jgi:phosphate:Na+ symporter
VDKYFKTKTMKKTYAFAFFLTIALLVCFAPTLHAKLTEDDFENVKVIPEKEALLLHWNINYDAFNRVQEGESSITIAYATQTDVKKTGYSEDEAWTFITDIPLDETAYLIGNLKGGENYFVKLGVLTEKGTSWSYVQEAQTTKPWGIFNLLLLIGALAMFLYGMKTMSDGLQRMAGKNLRNILASFTSNPFKGLLTGMGITALIQSSSVTTVMTVSFVNAGILTLTQSAGIIIGANIGTTLTAWIVDLFGFKMDISPYTLIMLAVGLPILFFKNPKLKGLGNGIIGFALLFMGLGFLKDSVPDITHDAPIVRFFVSLNDIPYFSTIIFVAFGALLTVIIQSSSATIALTMTLMITGTIPFEIGAAMVLGENIGTTITAEIAAMVGNVYAKRTARIHSTFNLIGVVWVILIFPFFLQFVSFLTEAIFGGSPILNTAAFGSTGLAVFHTTFNLSNALIQIWFIPYLVRFAEFTVRSRGKEDEQFRLDYINNPKATPELSILQAKKEIAKFGELTSKMSSFTRELLLESNSGKQYEIIERISKYEEITDRVEIEIGRYLNHIASGNLDVQLATRIHGMNSAVNSLERIGDIFYQISKNIEKKNAEGFEFSESQNSQLIEMLDLIDEAFRVMYTNLQKHSHEVTVFEAKEVERKINRKRDEIRQEHFDTMTHDVEFQIGRSIIYNNVFSLLERIGDHILNVTEGISGKYNGF